MNVWNDRDLTTYRSSPDATAEINEDDKTVTLDIEMVALPLIGSRPIPPVRLRVVVSLDPGDEHPDFAWVPYSSPATFTIGEAEFDGAILVVSPNQGAMP